MAFIEFGMRLLIHAMKRSTHYYSQVLILLKRKEKKKDLTEYNGKLILYFVYDSIISLI